MRLESMKPVDIESTNDFLKQDIDTAFDLGDYELQLVMLHKQ